MLTPMRPKISQADSCNSVVVDRILCTHPHSKGGWPMPSCTGSWSSAQTVLPSTSVSRASRSADPRGHSDPAGRGAFRFEYATYAFFPSNRYAQESARHRPQYPRPTAENGQRHNLGFDQFIFPAVTRHLEKGDYHRKRLFFLCNAIATILLILIKNLGSRAIEH